MAAAVPYVLMGVAAMGAIQQGHSQASALQSQAQAASYNAAVSRQQADQALQVSSAQQMQQRREARRILGIQRARGAEAAVGAGGSTADVLEQSETLAELDALNIAYEGSLRARGYSTQAELDDFYARSYRSQAQSTKRASFLAAIGGAGVVGYQTGVFGGRRTTVGGR